MYVSENFKWKVLNSDMKVTNFLAATLVIGAIGASVAPSHAQSSMGGYMPSNQSMMMSMDKGRAMEIYRARFIYNNLDSRAVKRYRAMGYDDATIKGAANLALRTGIPIDYFLGRIRIGGESLTQLASQLNVPTSYLLDDIPGYGTNIIMVAGMPTAPVGNGGSTVIGRMSGDITDVAMSNNDLSTLVAAIKAAGLVETLKGPGPFTVFAPTNAAFAKLPAGTVDELLKPENKEKLVAILTYHVIPGKVKAADVMSMSNPSMPKSVQGATLNVKTTAPVMVNDARVIATDIEASNGVIHLIDTVLMPPSN